LTATKPADYNTVQFVDGPCAAGSGKGNVHYAREGKLVVFSAGDLAKPKLVADHQLGV
jgi:hypothetical protein